MPELDPMIKQKDGWHGRYSESPDDPYYRLRPVHTRLYVRVRETGDWDLFRASGKWRGFSPGAAACHSQLFHKTVWAGSTRSIPQSLMIELAQSDKWVKIKFGLTRSCGSMATRFFVDGKSVWICRKSQNCLFWRSANTSKTPTSRANRIVPQRGGRKKRGEKERKERGERRLRGKSLLLVSRRVPWNGRGQRLVKLTEGSSSGGDSQSLPGWIK